MTALTLTLPQQVGPTREDISVTITLVLLNHGMMRLRLTLKLELIPLLPQFLSSKRFWNLMFMMINFQRMVPGLGRNFLLNVVIPCQSVIIMLFQKDWKKAGVETLWEAIDPIPRLLFRIIKAISGDQWSWRRSTRKKIRLTFSRLTKVLTLTMEIRHQQFPSCTGLPLCKWQFPLSVFYFHSFLFSRTSCISVSVSGSDE